MKKILIIFAILGICTGCTYSINMIHSEGNASDMIDENQKADADIKPNIQLPGTL